VVVPNLRFDLNNTNHIQIAYVQPDGTELTFRFDDNTSYDSVAALTAAYTSAWNASSNPLNALFDSNVDGSSGSRLATFYLQAKNGAQLDADNLSVRGTMPLHTNAALSLSQALDSGAANLQLIYQGVSNTTRPDGVQDNRLTFVFDGGISADKVNDLAQDWVSAFKTRAQSSLSMAQLFGVAPTYLPTASNITNSNASTGYGNGYFLHLTHDPLDSSRVIKADILLGSASDKAAIKGGKFTFNDGGKSFEFNLPNEFTDPSTGVADNKPGLSLSLVNTRAQAGDTLVLWDSSQFNSPKRLATHRLTADDIRKGQVTIEPDDFMVNGTYTFSASLTDRAGNTADLPDFVTLKIHHVDTPATGSISVVGDARLGQTLSVDTSALADLDGMGTLHFQWFVNGLLIEGAQSSTLTLGQDHVGQLVSVKVWFVDGSGARSEFEASAEHKVDDDANDAPVGVADDQVLDIEIGQALSLNAAQHLRDSDHGRWGVLQFSLDDASVANGFSIDADTGVVTHPGFIGMHSDTYTLRVQATDIAGLSATQTYTLNVLTPLSAELLSLSSATLGTIDWSSGSVTTTETLTFRYNLAPTRAEVGDVFELMNGSVRLGIQQVLTSEDVRRGYVDVNLSSLDTARSYQVSGVVVYEGRFWGQRSESIVLKGTQFSASTVHIQELRDASGPAQGPIELGGQSDDAKPTVLVRLSESLGALDELHLYDGDQRVLGQWSATGVAGTHWRFEPTNGFEDGAHSLRVDWHKGDGSLVQSQAFEWTLSQTKDPSITVSIDSVLTDDATSNTEYTTGAVVTDATLRIRGTLSQTLGEHESLKVYDGTVLLGTPTVEGLNWYVDTTAAQMKPGGHRLLARVENTQTQRQGEWSEPFVLQQVGELNLAIADADPAWVGRYVMIRVDTSISSYDNYWNLAELQVYSGSELISHRAPVRGNVNGSGLTDGNTSTHFETTRSVGWFQVDLGSSQAITAIDLWGRSNRADRLKGSVVFVSDMDMSSMGLAALKANTSTVTWVGTVGADAVKHSFSNSTAQTLRVTSLDDGLILSGTIQATPPANAELVIYLADKRVATATLDGRNWSVHLPTNLSLSNGYHEFRVQLISAKDDRVYASFTKPVFVDVPAPLVKSVAFEAVLDDVGSNMGAITTTSDDAMPTITAKLNERLAVGERLVLIDGANPVAGVWRAVDSSGTRWQFDPDAPLSLGDHALEIRWLGADGAQWAVSAVRTLTVTEPTDVLTNITTLQVEDDEDLEPEGLASGQSSDDPTPHIRGQLAEALLDNEVLRLYNGDQLQATITPDASGAWSYKPSALPTGIYRWQARVENTTSSAVGAFSPVHVFNSVEVPRVWVEAAQSPWVGRYVMFRGDDPSQTFRDGNWNPAEFKVYDLSGELISQGKPSSGITNAKFMNDGDTSNWQELSRSGSWWQVDLGAIHEIGRIEIFGRSDRADRLKGTMIFAGVEDMRDLTLAELQASALGSSKLIALTANLATATFNAQPIVWTTRDNTPTLTGEIQGALMPGEVLAVYQDGVLLGHAQVNGAQWSFTVPNDAALAVGDHRWRLQMETAQGTKIWQRHIDIHVDAPLDLDLLSHTWVDDVGVNQGSLAELRMSSDDDKPQLRGVLSAKLPLGVELLVMSAGQVVGRVSDWTPQANGQYAWRHNLNLAAGKHELVLVLRDMSTQTDRTLETFHYTTLLTSAPSWVESAQHGVLPLGVRALGDRLTFAGALGADIGEDEVLHIYLNGERLGTAEVNAQGKWSIELPTLAAAQHRLHWRVVRQTDGVSKTLIQGEDLVLNTTPSAPTANIRFNAQQKDDGWVIEGKGEPGTQRVIQWGDISTDVLTVNDRGHWKATFYINDSRFGKQAPLGINDVVVYERDPDSALLTPVGQFKAQVDVDAPQLLSMQVGASQVVAGQVVRVQLNFSEVPHDLTLSDFDVGGGTLHNLRVEGTRATVDLLVGQGLQAAHVTVGLKMGQWSDEAGNLGSNAHHLLSHVSLDKTGSSLLEAQQVLRPLTSQFALRAGSGMALDLRAAQIDLNNDRWSVLIELPKEIGLSHGQQDTSTGFWRVMGTDLASLRLSSSTAVDQNVLLKITYQQRASAQDAWSTHANSAVVGRFVPYVGAAGSSEDFNNFTRVKEAWNDGLLGYSGKGVLINVQEDTGQQVPTQSNFNLGNVLNSPNSEGVWAGGHGYGVMQRAAGNLDGTFRGAAFDALITWINNTPLPSTDIINRSLGAGSTFGTGWYDLRDSLSLRNGLGALVFNSAGNDGAPTSTERVTSKAADLMAVGSLNNSTGVPIYDYGDAKHISVPGWGGTSHASPLASGLAALILEANDKLGFRDVQSIVAYAARYLPSTGGGVGGFSLNGAHTLNGAGLHYSHRAGFGVFDVQAAVALARDWLKPEGHRAKTAFTDTADPKSVWMHTTPVADATPHVVSQQAHVVTSLSLTVTDAVTIESINFRFHLSASNLSKMQIRLVSPSGTESILMAASQIGSHNGWVQLTSRRFWGEPSQGEWTVKFYNSETISVTATVHSVHMDLYGVKNENDQRYIYTDEWRTTVDQVASASVRKQMLWLADQDGGKDSVYMSSMNSDVTVALGKHGYLALLDHRVGLINADSVRHAFGGRGDDGLVGHQHGGSLLVGNAGADTIVALGENNRIEGGAGADWIWFGLSDEVTGGEGADKFVLTQGGWSIADLADVQDLIADFDFKTDSLFRYDAVNNAFQMLRVFESDRFFDWVDVVESSLVEDLNAMRNSAPQAHIDNLQWTAGKLTVDFNQALQSRGLSWLVTNESMQSFADGSYASLSLNLTHQADVYTIDTAGQLTTAFGHALNYAHIVFGASDAVTLDWQNQTGNSYLWAAGENATLLGGRGHDVLVTEDHNGADTLKGGSGADRFVWKPGADLRAGISKVLDFNHQEGDVLDLSALFSWLNVSAQIDDHFRVSVLNDDAYLDFDLNSSSTFTDVFSIHLVGAASNGSISSSDDLKTLYTRQVLLA
jgi:subtilisin-like proprotein convertase family protein